MENNEEINEMLNQIEENFDCANLNQSINFILENYDSVCRKNNDSSDSWNSKDQSFFDFFMDTFPKCLEDLSNEVSDKFVVNKSYSHAKLLVLPYYSFSFKYTPYINNP